MSSYSESHSWTSGSVALDLANTRENGRCWAIWPLLGIAVSPKGNALALRAGCALFVTNDTDFRRVEGLPISSWMISSRKRVKYESEVDPS